MTHKLLKIVGVSIIFLTAGARAQDITGSGTVNTIPLFTGTSVIGNSGITQSAAGVGFSQSVGIGTTAPTSGVTLDVGEGVANPIVAIKNAWDPVGGFLGNAYSTLQLGMFNPTSTAVAGVPATTFATFFAVNEYGQTGSVAGAVFGGGLGIRNYLDDGSGNGSVAATFSAKNINLYSTLGGSITFQDGTIQTTAFLPANCGADFAESVDVSGNRTSYAPGDIMVIDPAAPGKFLKSNEAYSTLVAGIYSTKPGFVGRLHPRDAITDATEVPMAMVGRVPTKVSAENGPIHVGDLLVSSSKMGYAMKGTDRDRMLGAVIGKALGSLNSDTGVIQVLVTLQ